MIALLDSGAGAENTLLELRRLCPTIDVTVLKDVKNAPYGTKSEDELIKITEKNIERLLFLGADAVLIACCTASTVWHGLGEFYRRSSIPILKCIADEARRLTKSGTVAVIATERTVKSHAFDMLLDNVRTVPLASQPLVEFVESGERDGNVSRRCLEYLEGLLSNLAGVGADTLILGCTHFPALERTISAISLKYGIKNTVSSSLCGAKALFLRNDIRKDGGGITVRI